MSSSTSSDRRNIKTNGSLLHSPNSPPNSTASAKANIFSYTNSRLSPPTFTSNKPVDPYQDDAHLYDCPADYDLKPKETPTNPKNNSDLILNTTMNASIYDDSRIYDSPSDLFEMPPPIPAHKEEMSTSLKQMIKLPSADSSRQQQRPDSSSSELTVISSSGSYKTARELSTSTTPCQLDQRKVRQP